MVENELIRVLVDGGGRAAERCLVWLVDGASAPQVRVDLVWPAVPMPL